MRVSVVPFGTSATTSPSTLASFLNVASDNTITVSLTDINPFSNVSLSFVVSSLLVSTG